MIRQIGSNSLWLLLTRILTQGLYLVFTAVIARNLGVTGFGQFTVFATINFLGNIFTTYGIDILLIRDTARERRVPALASTAVWLQIFLSLIWCFLFFIGSLAFLPLGSTITLLVLNLSLLPLAFHTVFSSLLRAFERMDLFLGLNLFTASLQVIGAFALLNRPGEILFLCIWLLFTQALTAIFGGLLCKRTIRDFTLQWTPVAGDIVALLVSGWRTAALAPVALLSQRLNLLMLYLFSVDITTGLFAAASRLVEGLKLGHFAVTNSLMPSMSRPATEQHKNLYAISLYGLLSISIVLAFFVTFMSETIISVIFGSGFEGSIELLKILAWILIPYTFSVYYSLTLIMRGAELLVLKANILSLFFAVIAYAILIPTFGVQGAAWGTLVVEGFQAVILSIAHNRKSDTRSYAARPT